MSQSIESDIPWHNLTCELNANGFRWYVLKLIIYLNPTIESKYIYDFVRGVDGFDNFLSIHFDGNIFNHTYSARFIR